MDFIVDGNPEVTVDRIIAPRRWRTKLVDQTAGALAVAECNESLRKKAHTHWQSFPGSSSGNSADIQ